MKLRKNSHVIAIGLVIAVVLFLFLADWCLGCKREADPVVRDVATVRSMWFDGYSRTTLVVEYTGGTTGSLTACGVPPVWVGIHGDLYKAWNADRECYFVHLERK